MFISSAKKLKHLYNCIAIFWRCYLNVICRPSLSPSPVSQFTPQRCKFLTQLKNSNPNMSQGYRTIPNTYRRLFTFYTMIFSANEYAVWVGVCMLSSPKAQAFTPTLDWHSIDFSLQIPRQTVNTKCLRDVKPGSNLVVMDKFWKMVDSAGAIFEKLLNQCSH